MAGLGRFLFSGPWRPGGMAADAPPPLPSFAFEAVESILAASSGKPEESPTAKSERQETTSGRQDGISCALCEQPKRNGAYCPSHKRAYDTVYRAAMQPEARKQPAEDAVWDAALLTWKKTSHWFCFEHLRRRQATQIREVQAATISGTSALPICHRPPRRQREEEVES